MKSLTYLAIDLGCITIPLIASFYPRYSFFREWRYFFPANFMVAVLFLAWDYYFTKAGIWGFNPEYLTGIYFLNLPIEEILFFVCIPYACVFTYFALKHLIYKNPLTPYQRIISISLISTLLVVGTYNFQRAYTSVTFILTSGYVLYCLIRKKDLSFHYLAYLVILPFFFISNGILTGSIVDQPIVWYNDSENLGIRLATIPIEDIFYGLLLILLNIRFYTFLKEKYSGSSPF